MKLVIDIPKEMIEAAKTDLWCGSPTVGYAIKRGTPYEERLHGEWIPCKDDNFCKCSECQQIVMSEERSNFCPNCGADMRKRSETE